MRGAEKLDKIKKLDNSIFFQGVYKATEIMFFVSGNLTRFVDVLQGGISKTIIGEFLVKVFNFLTCFSDDFDTFLLNI